MNETAKAAKAEYMRIWREKNRQRIQEYQEKYWLKKAEEAAQADIEDIEISLAK